jgi:hypothetical protein
MAKVACGAGKNLRKHRLKPAFDFDKFIIPFVIHANKPRPAYRLAPGEFMSFLDEDDQDTDMNPAEVPKTVRKYFVDGVNETFRTELLQEILNPLNSLNTDFTCKTVMRGHQLITSVPGLAPGTIDKALRLPRNVAFTPQHRFNNIDLLFGQLGQIRSNGLLYSIARDERFRVQ